MSYRMPDEPIDMRGKGQDAADAAARVLERHADNILALLQPLPDQTQ